MDRGQVPLVDTVDMEILMHRNAHFGASFDMMLDYYHQEGVGVLPDFSLEQIQKLQHIEEEAGQDISELYLPEAAQHIVKAAQQAYARLRAVYGKEESEELAIKVSDLVLAEEDFPEKEIEALVETGREAVPALVELLRTEIFYDPLFPGYGRAPIFAAKTLAAIGDDRAITPLFDALGHDNFFTDEGIIRALCSFGESARDFLVQRVQQRPLSKDNDYAAIVLNAFPEEETIARVSLALLQDEDVLGKLSLASYLVFNCPGLTTSDERQTFCALARDEKTPKEIMREMKVVVKSWQRQGKIAKEGDS